MTSLVVVEHNNKEIASATKSTLAAAQKLNLEIWAIVIGFDCLGVAEQAQGFQCIKKIFCINDKLHEHHFAELHADQINQFLLQYNNVKNVLMSTSSLGKETMPRIAASQNVSQISDVTNILDNHEFERPIYAGNLTSRISSSEHIKLLTIRPTKFDTQILNGGDSIVESLKSIVADYKKKLVTREYTKSDRPDLASAKVVISGGRGLGSAENYLNTLEPLAKKMNAALGASRAAVDAGYAPNDYQVGQTGKIVAPEIYFAIGLSGSVQHLAGMKDSKIIIAINKDPDAPIFEVATYGLVADLFEVIPELTSKL
ncbi:MAG: electron transfer flavoprotein subunit alpha [Betaproteobacteria bacterium TMED41]|nr:MAG: electron transfer flavoprotein subunit alpha [Betaproteobacteria bacterium TMED41]